MGEQPRLSREPLTGQQVIEDLSMLRGEFDLIALSFAKTLQMTSGQGYKTPPKGKVLTGSNLVLEHLRRIDSTNYETGQSAVQIAKAINQSRQHVSATLSNLTNRKQVSSEQRGTRIRYFLSPS